MTPKPPPAESGGSEDDADIKFLEACARYFLQRPTVGEDMAHWANIYNAEHCRKIADRLRAEPQPASEAGEEAP